MISSSGDPVPGVVSRARSLARSAPPVGFGAAVGVVLAFAALARGAHDLWAATATHLAVLALAVALTAASSRRWCERLRTPFVPAALAFIVAGVASYAGAVNPSESFLALVDALCCLLLFYCSASIFRSDAAIRALLSVLAPVLWFHAVVMAAQLPEHLRLWFAADRTFWGLLPECPGLLVNSNLEAAFALLWLPIYRAASRRRPEAHAYRITEASLWVVLLLAGSAWAWIAAAAGLSFVVGWDRIAAEARARPRRAAVIGASALVFVVGVLAWKLAQKSASVPGMPGREGFTRFDWWASAWRMFMDNPWYGIGIGNFPSAYLAYKVGTGQHTLYAHSVVFTVLAETGIAGFGAAAFFLALWGARVVPSRAMEERAGFVGGVAAFLVFAAVSLGLEYLVNGLSLAVAFGAAAAPAVARRWRPRGSVAIIAAALAVASVPFLLDPFFASRYTVDASGFLAAKKWDDAEHLFSMAAALDPGAWEPRAGRARADFGRYEDTGKTAWAEEALVNQKAAVERNRLSATLWWEAGRYAEEAGHFDEAVRLVAEAHRLHPTDGNIAFDLDRLSAAQKKVRRPVRLPPHAPRPRAPRTV